MIYSAKIMGYIGQKQWDILSKTMGYIMGYIGQKLRIYWAMTMGYIEPKL